MKTYKISWGRHNLELGERTRIVGIVNVTPDSFSDGGKFFSFDAAVAHGEKLVADGADILDIGGESSRPFSDPVSADEELRRVLPVIEKLANSTSVPISIDTTKAVVARKAIEAGACIINDISALRLDPDMPAVAAESGVPIILMHMLGTPETMQVSPEYADVIEDIKTFLETAKNRAENAGIQREKIIIDPGIGFGKTVDHNLLLIRHLREFATLGVPVLIGPSRKAFIRNILKDPATKDIRPDLPMVEIGTQAAVAAAVLNGAHIVRAHNVANTRVTVNIIDAMNNSQSASST
ncbi:MAG: dihydropteroate synthase [Deltaproteobacteria bacterium]|nr:dihydropteroate synthase [Deltaproteobacteria bacterium]